MTRSLALAAASLLAFAGSAAAQDECSEGRLRMEGRCCWPGQTWSVELGRCDGAPSCPGDLVEHGEACIAPATHAPMVYGPGLTPYTPTLESTASSTDAWPFAEGSDIAPSRTATTGRGEDEVHIAGSFALFDVGWVAGWVGVMIDEANASCGGGHGSFGSRHSCDSWPLAFIPVVGGILATTVTFNEWRSSGNPGIAHGIISVIFQILGLVAIPISLANETTELTYPSIDLGAGVTASISPTAPGASEGASFLLSF